jgi:NADH dehydrogenase FAD-containing subunit
MKGAWVMPKKKILVIGGNFAGLTAAIHLKQDLHEDVDVTVISDSDAFKFVPSYIWVPFGKRKPQDITFPVAPTFESQGVEFVLSEATRIHGAANTVETTKGMFPFDYLVIATGFRNQFDVIPGLGPGGHAFNITTLEGAVQTHTGWQNFVNDPGPVIIGATQSAGCFGAAYEFLFNIAYQIKKHGLKKRAKITYVTSEPFLGHFGVGGLPGGEKLLQTFLNHLGIEAITNVAMKEVLPGELHLEDGRVLPFKFSMIIPPFKGAEMIFRSGDIGDEKGFVPVLDTYQSARYRNIYATGVAAAVNYPWHSAVAIGVPKTGFPTETQAKVAAKNIASQIRGEEPKEHKDFGDIPAVCVMDAGNNGVILLSDRMLPPRKFGVLIPGPQAHLAKLMFEKYYLWKASHGYVNLP